VTESELVRQCQKGNPQAQRALFDAYSNRMYRLALRYVKIQDDGQDIVMMAFVKVFRNIKSFSYRDEGSTEAWIRKIVVNEALMWLRKRNNFNLTEALDGDNPEHDVGVLSQIDVEHLFQLILELPPGYRTVFNLNVIEGYDHHEIAEMLNIAESTSRSQLFKAKQLLKRKIEQEDIQYGTG
jgi:RNA polymerase sigma factor (sigma-70 family)